MFKTAKTLDNAAGIAKGKKKERELVPMSGIEKLAHLDAVIKTATAAKEVLESGLKGMINRMFLERIKKADGKKPDSFYGSEGHAEVNFQMKKRSTMSALNEEERETLDKLKVPYHREVITQKLFAINPNYAMDEAMLEKVEKALAKLNLPEDFIVMQEEKAKYVVDEDCLDRALRSSDPEAIKITTTLAFKPMLTEMIPSEIAKTIQELMVPEVEAEEPVAEAKTPAAKKPRATKAAK